MKKYLIFGIIFLLISTMAPAQIQSPDDFLGFPLGADRKLADYHQILDYFNSIEKASPRIKVINLGKTTEDNDLFIAVISSADNIQKLDHYKKISYQLAHPEQIREEEADELIESGKVVTFITCNIHSTEIGASQMAMEFAYKLITRDDDEIQFYLDNVILVLMPSANPDGQIMVCDWYRQWVGTEYEGGRMPWLYHKYVGHDTNRDFYMLNLRESKLINKVMSQEWFPQVHLDEHQMGNSGPRMFVPPYKDPMSPNLSPLLLRLEALYGTNMSFRLEEEGKAGVIDSWAFDSYWPGGTRTAAWKNIVSLLTELASCRIATPIYVEENELSGGRKGMVEYKQQVNFPNPWQGGWWRLRDIIDYELIASYAFLEISAKYRKDILKGFYQMNVEAIEQGKSEPPFAYVIPTFQHDEITAVKLVELLLEHDIRIYQSTAELIVNGRFYKPGSYIIPLAQPLRPLIKEMLDTQRFPEVKLSSGSEPIYPYDVTAWSLPLMMNVNCDAVAQPVDVAMKPVSKAVFPTGRITGESQYGYALSHQFNDASIAVNRLLQGNFDVLAAKDAFENNGVNFDPGTILIPQQKNLNDELQSIADDLHLTFHSLDQPIPKMAYELESVRVGMIKPWRASMDEGWTRWLLEQFEFNLVSLTNDMIKKGNLNKNYQAIIIPAIGKSTIINPKPSNSSQAKYYRPFPEKYEGGIGEEGVDNLREFVKKGGTLITLDSGCELPIDEFPLPVSNTLDNKSRSEYYAPGVIVKALIDKHHPVGWGMPESFAAFNKMSPAFRTYAPFGDMDRKVVAHYPDEPLLLSGWLKGEEHLHRKAAIVDIKYGEGKVVLIGFRAQHRAQPHGTFKILFNAIHYAGIK